MKKFYFLVFLFIGLVSFGQTGVTTYQYLFNNSLAEQSGGPALTDTLTCGATVAGYGSQTVCTGGTKTVLNFNAGEGLLFRNDTGFLKQTYSYTINILMKYNSLDGTGNPSKVQRIITFDTATGIGIYSYPKSVPIPNGVVEFDTTGTGPFADPNMEIPENNFFLFSIVRIGGGVDSVYFYINGKKGDSVTDKLQRFLAPKGSPPSFYFFLDNGTTGDPFYCEVGPGSVSYISVSDFAFTPAQVDSTSQAHCPIVLPLRLLDFHANKQSGAVALSWTTANEINTDHFELERGSDGINFSRIASISTNNNTSVNNYSYTDHNPLPTIYYRLKMVDIDGKYSYSSVLKINFVGTEKFEVFPNPANSTITVSGINNNQIVKLLSLDGKLLMQKRASGQTMTMDISSYSSGVYLLQYFDGTSLQNRKIIKK